MSNFWSREDNNTNANTNKSTSTAGRTLSVGEDAQDAREEWATHPQAAYGTLADMTPADATLELKRMEDALGTVEEEDDFLNDLVSSLGWLRSVRGSTTGLARMLPVGSKTE